MKTLDGNTDACERHEAEQDRNDEILRAYGEQVREMMVERILAESVDDVLDVFFDDPWAALDKDEDAFRVAASSGNEAYMGRLIYKALEHIADDQFVTQELINDKAREMAREER